MALSRATLGSGINPSDVGPTFSRKFPPLLDVSTSSRISLFFDFQLSSSRLNPHVSFIVSHVSQSTPGIPNPGISCSGVSKSPAPLYLLFPDIPSRAFPTRLLVMISGWRDRTYAYRSFPRSSVHSGIHSPSNHSTPIGP